VTGGGAASQRRTSRRSSSKTTAPTVALTMALTQKLPMPGMWRTPNSQLPMKAPMMPTMRSPMTPKPLPTRMLASQPAISPTMRTTIKLSMKTPLAPDADDQFGAGMGLHAVAIAVGCQPAAVGAGS